MRTIGAESKLTPPNPAPLHSGARFCATHPDFLVHHCSMSNQSGALIPFHVIQYTLMSARLLLWSESWSTNVGTSELDTENALHVGKDLLVWSGGSVLELSDNGWSGVALGGQVLLGHLWLHLLALGGDGAADDLADGSWLDDIIRAVDLGQVLTLNTRLGGLLSLLVTV